MLNNIYSGLFCVLFKPCDSKSFLLLQCFFKKNRLYVLLYRLVEPYYEEKHNMDNSRGDGCLFLGTYLVGSGVY